MPASNCSAMHRRVNSGSIHRWVRRSRARAGAQISAWLLRGDEQRAYPDLATLTAALTGAALPVSELFQWLQGHPAQPPGSTVPFGPADGRMLARRLEGRPERDAAPDTRPPATLKSIH